MSYTPTQWQTGDTITAEKLNHIEQGLFETVDNVIILNDKAEPFIVTLTPTAQDFSGTMDKTPKEIYDAYMAGRQIRAKMLGIYGDAKLNLWAFMTSAELRYDPEAPEWGYYTSNIEVKFEFVLLYGESYFLVLAQTSSQASIYKTTVFPLTPMS